MAITTTATSVYAMNEPPKQAAATPFFQNFYITDNASGCETVKAAVTGYSMVITHLVVSADGDITVTIGEGETGGAVTTVLVGPLVFTATGMVYDLHFKQPITLTAATALTVDASGAGPVTVIAEGFLIA